MKKYILIIISVLLVFGSRSLVSANGGPHGGYTATTDACAGCHRTHTATGPRLLISNSTYGLCISCHGSTAAGANTNVEDGIYLSSRDDTVANEDHGAANTPDGSPLLGGGFNYYQGSQVTSRHDMSGDPSELLAWGNDVARGSTAAITDPEFSCASCHDPHGSTNYRLIKTEVNGTPVQVNQVDEGAKDYDTEHWDAGTSMLCAACHRAYHETAAGVGSDVDVQQFGGGFTHRVDMPYHYKNNDNPENVGFTDDSGVTVRVPLAQSGTSDIVVCMTCHIPHGSASVMFGNAAGSGLPGETAADDSALLRLDNRGVCQACHQK
jgi:predicted CXXCH cytochrome family protein